ncbi:MAG: internal scaffolding protein [Microviridae sp.]|nr:MAG: internal scaffolding protein [Microviridae sp.]
MNVKDSFKGPHVRCGYERHRVQFTPKGHSMTKQAFKDECDINNIMKRFERDGMVAHYNKYGGEYGDFTDCPEYHEAQNKVLAANEMFLTLPSKVRERFKNDPGAFLAFVSDKANYQEMVDIGLAKSLLPVKAAAASVEAAKV